MADANITASFNIILQLRIKICQNKIWVFMGIFLFRMFDFGLKNR